MLTAQPELESRPLPIWLSIPIILLCLASGGWIIHWYLMSDPLSHQLTLLADPPPARPWGGQAGRNGGQNQLPPRPFIRDAGNNTWEVRTDRADLDVSFRGGNARVASINYGTAYNFVPAETRYTIRSARIIIGDADRICALKLSSDSVKQLRALTSTITMAVSEADKQQLTSLLQAYVQTPDAQKPALQPKIYQTLDQIAQRSQAATRQQAVERAAQINKLITPDQWKQFQSSSGR
jgi:hypothetical protein